MITAIITQLKTGSIKNVIPRGDTLANPTAPYVVVWKDAPIQQQGNTGLNQYYVSVHYPRGFINQVNDYIENECATLLDGKILTTRDGRKVQLNKTMEISPLIDNNDDTTISQDRLFDSVAIY